MANGSNPHPDPSSPMANASRLGLTTTGVQSRVNTSSLGRLYRKWDAEADTHAFSAHNAGNSADEIAKQLIGQGYAVTRAEVVGSLYLQGVPNARLGPMPAARYGWNKLADVFTLAASNANKNVSEILAGLTDQGYTVTETEVRESLARQGK